MAKHGYESVSVEEVRNELRKKGVTDEEVLGQNKKALVDLLVSTTPDESEEESLLLDEPLEETALDAVADIPHESQLLDQPPFNSEKWNEWVMAQFNQDELSDGAPYCDALRRVAELVLGGIEKVEIISNVPPSPANNGTATVVIGVTIPKVSLEDHPRFGEPIYVEDIADCNKMNTPQEYLAHPSATAATRAESRVYRKMLRLKKILSAEESNADKAAAINQDWTPADPISDEQINVLELVCKRANVSLLDFINSGRDHYEFVEQVTEHTASVMLQHLNRIQRGDADKPKEVGPFDSNWRTKNDSKRESIIGKRV